VKMSRMVSLFRGTIVALVIGLLFACNGQNGSKLTEAGIEQDGQQGVDLQADILFDTLVHDFGTIIEGEMVVCYFDYENRGEGDLVIASVAATCGCTTPDWSKEPLKPGQRGQLKVVFDTRGRSGSQFKGVSVVSNSVTPNTKLTIKANVTVNQ
jgi:hypothetical protein